MANKKNENVSKSVKNVSRVMSMTMAVSSLVAIVPNGVGAVIDMAPPTIGSFSPANNATDVATNADLVFTSNEIINRMPMLNIKIYDSANTLVESIDLTDAVKVTAIGNVHTINPTTVLARGTNYYVQLEAGALKDVAGNAFAGIMDNTTWTFTTKPNTAPIVSSGIPDINVKGSGLTTLNLNNVFTDADNDYLNYSVAYTSGSIISSAGIGSGNLTINYNSPGTATLTVNVDDKFGGTNATTFNVVVSADAPVIHSASITSAPPVNGIYKKGDIITMTVVADAPGYTESAVQMNGRSVVETKDGSNGISNTYVYHYTVTEGDTDLNGSLPISVVLTKPSSSLSNSPYTIPLSGAFTLDANSPKVVSAVTSVNGSEIELTFDEVLDPAQLFNPFDFVLTNTFTARINHVELDVSNHAKLKLQVSGVIHLNEPISLSLNSGAVTDVSGNDSLSSTGNVVNTSTITNSVPLSGPSMLMFTDTNLMPGVIEGTATATKATSESDILFYILSWADSNGNLIDGLNALDLQIPNGSNITFNIHPNTQIPAGATKLLALAYNYLGFSTTQSVFSLLDKGYAPALTVSTEDLTDAINNDKTRLKIIETPSAGNAFVYKNYNSIQSLSTPAVGELLTGYLPIPLDGIIAALPNDLIAIAEVDGNGYVVRFGHTKALITQTAPPLTSLLFKDAPGVGANFYTDIDLGVPDAGNTFQYIYLSETNPLLTMNLGDSFYGTVVTDVDFIRAEPGQKIGVAEVNSAGKVVKYSVGNAVVVNESPGTFEFAQSNVAAAESAGFVELTVQRFNGSAGEATIYYEVKPGGTALRDGLDADYTLADGSLTFASGENSKSISIPIINDQLMEKDEFFLVQLSATPPPNVMVLLNTTASAVIGNNNTALVSIINDDFLSPTLRVWSEELSGVINNDKTLIKVDEIAGTGNKFVYQNLTNQSISVPVIGDLLPGGYSDLLADSFITPANTSANIPSNTTSIIAAIITANHGDQIAVVEVTADNHIVKFGVTSAIVIPTAPALASGFSFEDVLGIENNGKTKINLGPVIEGHSYKYMVLDHAMPIESMNEGEHTFMGWSSITDQSYLSMTNGQLIGVAEIDNATGTVVRYSVGTAVVVNNEAASGLFVYTEDQVGIENNGFTKLSIAESAGTGKKFVYKNFMKGTVNIPNVGDVLNMSLSSGYSDLPSNNLIAADSGDYIGVAEISLNGTPIISRFGIAKANMIHSALLLATPISFTDPLGTMNNYKTRIQLGVPDEGNYYKYIYLNNANLMYIPNQGENTLLGWLPIADGELIQAENGRPVGVAEVDANGFIVRYSTGVADVFNEEVAAPELFAGVSFVDAIGVNSDGKTQAVLGSEQTGHSFKYKKFPIHSTVVVPFIGDSTSNPDEWTTITDGGFIAALDGQYIGVAKVDADQRVVEFSVGVANVISESAAPIATDLFVYGTAAVGQTLTGNYYYSDVNGDLEEVGLNGTKFQWYVTTDMAGSVKTAIAGATSHELTITSDLLSKFLIFEVIPVANTGILTGLAAQSGVIGPVKLKIPQHLTADYSNPYTVSPIEILFADDTAWRNAITEVKVDSALLAPSKYTITAGKLTINGGVLSEGAHHITVVADGYDEVKTIQDISLSTKSFSINSEAGSVLNRANGGITATANIAANPISWYEGHEGNEVIVFQLMNGSTPVSIVALEADIYYGGTFSAHFNVTDPNNLNYKVKVLVLNSFSSDTTSVGLNLANVVTLN